MKMSDEKRDNRSALNTSDLYNNNNNINRRNENESDIDFIQDVVESRVRLQQDVERSSDEIATKATHN
jgi:hypothetical protein